MKAQIYSSIKKRNDRLTRQKDVVFTNNENLTKDSVLRTPQHSITIDNGVKFQEIEGFGGAMTESTAWLINQMTQENQQEVLDAYYGESGNNYNYTRIHMNSCDFSLDNYSYCEDNDTELRTFSIDREKKYTIPCLLAAKERAEDLRIYFSPWSPPAWMKTNNDMNNGGKLKPEYYALWADYYCHFIDEMHKANIDFWGLTVQNEPLATQNFDSCVWEDEEERDFIKNFLGPELHRNGFKGLKLMIYDHNRDKIFKRAKAVFDDPEAAKYVWGTAYHWYEEQFENAMFQNLNWTHLRYPDKKLFFSEGCCGGNSIHLGSWEAGERYSYNIIGDMNNYCVAWIDWNMVLDIETGGPRHVSNACSAPILCDIENQTLHYQPSYYHIGHFSRFVKRGARRIISCTSTCNLHTTAFENPNGSIVVVVMNRQDNDIDYMLTLENYSIQHIAQTHSIETFIIDRT